MGCCPNNNLLKKYIFCNNELDEKNLIVINIDINKEKKDIPDYEENKDEINNDFNQNGTIKLSNTDLNHQNQKNNNIVIYNLQTRFKSKILKSSFGVISNNTFNAKNNKYNRNNEQFEKFIYFTNFNNISTTTNSIIK